MKTSIAVIAKHSSQISIDSMPSSLECPWCDCIAGLRFKTMILDIKGKKRIVTSECYQCPCCKIAFDSEQTLDITLDYITLMQYANWP